MKRALSSLLVLSLFATNTYADGAKDAVTAMSGKWTNTATHQNFSINKRGIVGRTAAVCGEMYSQNFGMRSGADWLANAEQLAKDKFIPRSHYNALAKEIDRNKTYPHLSSSCEETGDQMLLISPDTMVSIACSDGGCLVVRDVRAR